VPLSKLLSVKNSLDVFILWAGPAFASIFDSGKCYASVFPTATEYYYVFSIRYVWHDTILTCTRLFICGMSYDMADAYCFSFAYWTGRIEHKLTCCSINLYLLRLLWHAPTFPYICCMVFA